MWSTASFVSLIIHSTGWEDNSRLMNGPIDVLLCCLPGLFLFLFSVFLAFSRTVALITALIFHVWRPSLLLKRTSAVVLLSATSTLQFWPRLIKCSVAQSTGEITIQWIRIMDTNCVIRWWFMQWIALYTFWITRACQLLTVIQTG